jgi:ElaB/YqjD/DUF883 family membrane-anchored ribosome-binding protein
MAGASDFGGQGNPQQGSHPRMGTTPPTGSSGAQPSASHGQGGAGETFRQTGSSMSETAGQMKEKAQEFASGAASRIGDAWESTQQGLQQGASTVRQTAQDFWNNSGDLIRRYPIAAVAIAFGLGCLVTALVRVPDWGEDEMAQRMSRYSA